MRTPELRIDPRPRFRFALGLATVALLVAPLAARAGDHRSSTRTSMRSDFYTTDGDSNFGWSLYDPKEGNVTGSTDGDDWTDIQRALESEEAKVFWFKIDGDRFVVRDPEIVARVDERTQPIRELGKKQGELGARQGALGLEQGKLGLEQGRLGRRQGVLSQRLARYAADDARDGEESHRTEKRAIQREIDEIGDRMRELGEQQSELGAKQTPLGEQQAELGRQQSELSRKASIDLRKIADEALRDGKAQRLGGVRRRTI